MNMNLLGVVTPPPIYHGCSTRKTSWYKTFTLGTFTPVNMKHFGRRNVRKHREINNGENYITLGISLKFGSLHKMKITSSNPNDYLRILGKGLITSLDIKTIVRSNK